MAITEWPSRFPVLNSGGGFHAVGEHLTALIGVDAKKNSGQDRVLSCLYRWGRDYSVRRYVVYQKPIFFSQNWRRTPAVV